MRCRACCSAGSARDRRRGCCDALEDGLGGVVLFGSNLGDGTEVAAADRAHCARAAGRDIVIALDEEGGDVTRLDTVRGSSSPGAAALGHRDDRGRDRVACTGAIGARCAAAGVTLDLAPVADVNVDPLNPVIGLRAFSADPQVAARHVAAAVRGIQAAGVAACVKHFPGHGATADDRTTQVATVDRDRARARGDRAAAVPRRHRRRRARGDDRAPAACPALDPDHLATAQPRDHHTTCCAARSASPARSSRTRSRCARWPTASGWSRAASARSPPAPTRSRPARRTIPTWRRRSPTRSCARSHDGPARPRRRVVDAAARTAALAAHRPDRHAACRCADAAAVEVIGALPGCVRPLVVECRTPGGMASGELPWSLGTHLSPLLPGTRDPARRPTPIELPHRPRPRARRARPASRAVAACDCCARATVVVDCGWPGRPPDRPTIRTRGIAPRLLARPRTPSPQEARDDHATPAR